MYTKLCMLKKREQNFSYLFSGTHGLFTKKKKQKKSDILAYKEMFSKFQRVGKDRALSLITLQIIVGRRSTITITNKTI